MDHFWWILIIIVHLQIGGIATFHHGVLNTEDIIHIDVILLRNRLLLVGFIIDVKLAELSSSIVITDLEYEASIEGWFIVMLAAIEGKGLGDFFSRPIRLAIWDNDYVILTNPDGTARIRELLENVGLAQESLPSSVVGSAQVLASVANLLNIRDTELSSFLVSMGDVSLRKSGVEEKRAKVQKESKVLLDYTRKAIARLTYLKRVLAQLKDEVAPCEAQIENWKTNLPLLVSKEREYNQRYSNQLYELLFNSTVLREP
ncbi:hypothetical protein BVRB_6g145320 [Beta vulgaris subsp. vulgaris]|uniref:Uncharacterized protein n=1 Tax=Beta vulgaris subsp. vulgaris TaxID=3555 RepID=A0A0J8C6S8_BETVV|nr:hypothetical protein BVRB_6g145320 [Beta vulgaris subsp. vulgaris]